MIILRDTTKRTVSAADTNEHLFARFPIPAYSIADGDTLSVRILSEMQIPEDAAQQTLNVFCKMDGSFVPSGMFLTVIAANAKALFPVIPVAFVYVAGVGLVSCIANYQSGLTIPLMDWAFGDVSSEQSIGDPANLVTAFNPNIAHVLDVMAVWTVVKASNLVICRAAQVEWFTPNRGHSTGS